MSVNMVFNLMLIVPLQHTGLALATSLSAYLNAYLLWRSLKMIYQPTAGWLVFMLRIGIASVALCALLILVAPPLEVWLMQTVWQRAGGLVFWVLAGAAVYMVTLLVFGMRFRHLKN
jgi:putative peptidoglycan lipid II flippase